MGRLPDTLPDGCKRRMSLHLNFGSKGHAANFDIFLPDGTALPIHYQYHTGKEADTPPTGFFVAGVEKCFSTWAEVRAAWPELVIKLNNPNSPKNPKRRFKIKGDPK